MEDTQKKTKKKHRGALIILIVVVVALGALVVINPFDSLIAKLQETTAEAAPVESSKVSVRVDPLSLTSIDQVIEGNGNVIDPSSLDVYPEVAGTMTELAVAVGDRVEKDQVLAVIDPSRAGMVYKSSTVTSPSAGTVLAVPFVEGATVGPQAPIVRLGLIDDLEVVMHIAEQYIGRVLIGTEAELTFAAYPGEVFSATVSYLSPVLNPTARTMEIRLTIHDPERMVKSGMFPAVRLLTGHKDDVISIDRSSIVYEGVKSYVYIAEEAGTAKKVEVSTGIQMGQTVEITSGLSAGDRLIVEGQTLLTDGAELNILQ